jgi:uncharacterized protein YpmB
MYILTFAIIVFLLISAVIVHLQLGFHKQLVPKHEVKKPDDEDRETLHRMIFQEYEDTERDDRIPPKLHETIFKQPG